MRGVTLRVFALCAMLSSPPLAQATQSLPAFGVASASRRSGSAQLDWTRVPTSVNDSAPALVDHSAAILSFNNTNHSMVLFGGRTLTDSGLTTLTSDLWSLDIEDLSWSQIVTNGASPAVREKHSACSNGSHMLIHGGRAVKVLRDSWLLDWETKSWHAMTLSTSVDATLASHSSVWIGDTVYLFGGYDSSALNRNSLITLNVATSTWAEVAGAGSAGWPYARSLHSAAVLGNCMIIYGGQYQLSGSADDGVALGDIWSFCEPDGWTPIVNSTQHWDNKTHGFTSNNSGAPVSGHTVVAVSESLMVSVSGHSYAYFERLWYANPVIRAFEYYGDIARKVLGSWQTKDPQGGEVCAAVGACELSADYLTAASCQDACDLSAHLGCNSLEFRMLSSVGECCMQRCTDPVGSQTSVGYEGLARVDSDERGSFLFPSVQVAADVVSQVEGHTAVSVGSAVYVYGGQAADGSMLNSLSTFDFQGSGCPAGSKGLANSASCGLCDIGSFSAAVGGYSCIPCGPGTYSNIEGSSICLQCPAGTFRTAHGGTNTSDCESCPSGKYSIVQGATTNAVCVDCSSGYFSAAGAVECSSCPPGSFNPNEGQAGYSSADGCLLCPPGSYSLASSANCTMCDEGSYNAKSGRTVCLPCPAGYFGTINRTACDACSAGYYSPVKGAVNSSVCLGCDAGSYSHTASSTCTDCSVGRYASSPLNTNSTDCVACPVGRASALQGASHLDSCLMCVPGSYSAEAGAETCSKCAQSKYLEVSGAMYESDCQACPPGTSTMSDGSSKATDCSSCPIGYGQNAVGVCTVCETGRFSTVSASTANATCAMCGVGKYADLVEQSTCMECEAGKFAQMGWVSCSSCNASFTCPTCSDHGTCQLGECVCNSGYGGADCNEELCPSTNCDPSTDMTIYFEQSVFRVREDNVYAALPTLIRRGCCAAELTVNVSLVADTAELGTDFSASIVSSLFNSGSDTASINIPVVQDSMVESCEMLNLTADLSGVISGGSMLSARVELEDDDVDSAEQYSTVKSTASYVKPSMLNVYLAPRASETFSFTVNVTRPEDAQCVGCPTGDSDCMSAHGASSYCQTDSLTCSGHSTPCACTGCSEQEIDILLIQDLSGSFNDDLPNTRQLVANMMADLSAIYPNVNFGVASFVDKPISPFGQAGDYEWRVHRPLTADTISVDDAVSRLTIFNGGNAEESQLTALLQASKQHSTVGWREGAYKIAVVITDAPFAYQGFGAQATPPITNQNNQDSIIDSLNEDYPSVEMVRAALREQSIRPLFAVTSNVKSLYDDLVTDLGDGITIELEPDSSNFVSVVRDGVRQLEETLTVVADAASYWEEWTTSALSGSVTTHDTSCYDLDTAKAHCEAAGTACSGVSESASCASLSPWRLHSDRVVSASNYSSWLHVGSTTAATVTYLGTDGTMSETATGIKGGQTASFSVTLNAGSASTGDTSFSLLSPGLGRSLVYVSRAELSGCADTCPNECSGHGTCSVSTCQCDSGYSQKDCSVSSGTLAPGLADNGDMEAGTGTDDGAVSWVGSGAGYTHDKTGGFGAQEGASILLKPSGAATQTVHSGEGLPVNAMPMAVSVWSKASATDAATAGVIPGHAHYMSIAFTFANGSTWTDVITFDSGVYGWRAFSRQYLQLAALQSITVEFALPGSTLGSVQGAAHVDAFSLLPDPEQACFCDNGYYWLEGYNGNCKRCEPGFFCGSGGKFVCGANEYSHGGATECSSCPEGWLCEDGIGYPCAAPNFLHTNTRTSTTACLPCPYGSDCTGGYATPCAAGSYAGIGMNECVLCKPGTISSTCGSESCTECPAGKTSNYARTGCVGCGPGEWSSVGSHPCSTCAPGRYSAGGPAPRYPVADYTQVASDQWCYPSSDFKTTLFLYGFNTLYSCYQRCSTTEGCTYFAHWYGDHTGTCTLWTECTDDIESQGPYADSSEFFSHSASVTNTTSTTSSSVTLSHGYFNRVYKMEASSCQAAQCNRRQVGLRFQVAIDTTAISMAASALTLSTATWNSYASTLEFWLYIPAQLDSSEVVVSKLQDATKRYDSSNSGGWIVELDADSVTLRFTTISRAYSYSSAVYTKSTSLALGEWSHVAIVRDSTSAITFVIDGAEATGLHGSCCPQQDSYDPGTDYLPGQSTTDVDHTYGQTDIANLYLGDHPVAFGPAVSGLKVTGIRMWDSALPSATVALYMDSCIESSHPYFADLKHDYELDQGSGDIVQDGVLSDETASVGTDLVWWGEALAAAAVSSPSSSSSTTDSSNATLCTACPIGFYAELEGLTACAACADGTNTTTIGTVNASSCV